MNNNVNNKETKANGDVSSVSKVTKKPSRSKLSPEREQELKKMVAHVEKSYGKDERLMVDEDERRANVRRKRGPLTEKLKNTVVYMYNKGCTYKEITQITGAASASINKILDERRPGHTDTLIID